MSSSSKSNAPSKVGSSPNISPEVAAEIAYLMRTPGALSGGLQRPGGRGHYDPNQPRVPAGDPKGGQFASKGYRSGGSDHDARVALASLDGAQFAQLSQGNPRDAFAQVQPFDGLFGEISAGQHLVSQNGFIRTDSDRRRNRAMQDLQSLDGRYRFVSTGPGDRQPIPGGYRWIISSNTFVHDTRTGAYATILATPARPMIITTSYDKLFVRPFNRQFDSR